jgi:hypothetical protein
MTPSRTESHRCQNLVIGGGIAGIVTALELLDRSMSVVLVDRDTPRRFGGLALWAFGGMALVGTKEQKKYRIPDSPELALEDWIRFGELGPEEHWPRAWAECYVHESREWVYEWVKNLGLKFMPAVNWVERGSSIRGNSVARYHLLWGTGRELVQTLAGRLLNHPNADRLTVLHRHRARSLEFRDGRVTGCSGTDEASGGSFSVEADNTIIATGGVNGSEEQVRKHWPGHWPPLPERILNGAHPFASGEIHESLAARGGRLTHLDKMWNYAAGIPHPQPHFQGHGLSLIPCKTGLWLSPDGAELGPAPMVTGYDTRELCRQVVAHPYTWQVLNWKIAAKEMAISGAEHNPRIVKHQLIRFLLETVTGSDRLLRQMAAESTENERSQRRESHRSRGAFETGGSLRPDHVGSGKQGNGLPDFPNPPASRMARRRPSHLPNAADQRPKSRPAAGHPASFHQPQKPWRHPDRLTKPGFERCRPGHAGSVRGRRGRGVWRGRRLGKTLPRRHFPQRLHPHCPQSRRRNRFLNPASKPGSPSQASSGIPSRRSLALYARASSQSRSPPNSSSAFA